MNKKIIYSVLGLLGLIIFIIALAPARAIFPFIVEKMPGLSISQAQGTLWSSKIEQAQFKDLELQNIELEVSPFALATGEIGGQIRIEDTALQMEGAYGLAHESVELEALTFSVDADWLKQVAKLPLDSLEGEINGELKQLIFKPKGKQIEALNGQGTWANAAFAMANISLQLGTIDYQLTNKDQQTLELEILDNSGPLDLKGTISLNLRGSYQININMTEDLPSDIAGAVKAFGRVTNGRVEIQWRGKLP